MHPFLTARWRDLIVVNYEVEQSALQPYIPAGTELDLWQGKALVSLVAFRFLDTRVLGALALFHRDFEEANLRFYVKRRDGETLKRGVVFIKEIVPKRLVAAIARLAYGENYVYAPMSHRIDADDETRRVQYGWRTGDRENTVSAEVSGEPQPLAPGSEAEFILEHYWGYARRGTSKTVEYEVAHPPWRCWDQGQFDVAIDMAATYGPDWARAIATEWRSAFLAEGSEVTVFQGRTLGES